MNVKKMIMFAAVFVLGMALQNNTVNAQSKANEGNWYEELKGFFNANPNTNAQKLYKTKNNQSVKVTISDLDLADLATMSVGSFYSAFKDKTPLEVSELSFAPNAADGFFYLSFSTPKTETTKILILDVAGREVHNEVIEDFKGGTYETKIEVPLNAKGTYFLKIIQGLSLLNKKLVIE